MLRYFPFKIETIQTDNGFEFTNRLSWNAFTKTKETLSIDFVGFLLYNTLH